MFERYPERTRRIMHEFLAEVWEARQSAETKEERLQAIERILGARAEQEPDPRVSRDIHAPPVPETPTITRRRWRTRRRQAVGERGRPDGE